MVVLMGITVVYKSTFTARGSREKGKNAPGGWEYKRCENRETGGVPVKNATFKGFDEVY